MRIEMLNKDNFETWKIQMKALLIKNDSWTYVNGKNVKPQLKEGDEESAKQCAKWDDLDEKSKADIILCIAPSELKQVKHCKTSSELWNKLEEIYQSKGPARKASLLKSLIQLRMNDADDIRGHLRTFFDIVDKLSEMDITVDQDLLAIMLLYSLPSTFENFRCAIESRDELPSVESLRVKIVEEADARRGTGREKTEAYAAVPSQRKQPWTRWKRGGATPNRNGRTDFKKNDTSKIRCFRCQRIGHTASKCDQQQRKEAPHVGLLTTDYNQESSFLSSDEKMSTSFILDSGCTRHLCNDSKMFEYIDNTVITSVNLADDNKADVKGCGTVVTKAEVNGNVQNVTVYDALYVPNIRANLLSISKLCDNGYSVSFSGEKAEIINNQCNIKLGAERRGNLYYLNGDFQERNNDQCVNHASDAFDGSKNKTANIVKWHARMGHMNIKDLVECSKKGNVEGLNLEKITQEFNCDICALNKLTRAPFPKRSEHSSSVLDIVISDLCGPFKIESLGKCLYFITFIDHSTRYCEVRFLKHKNEALSAFKEVKALWENQKSTKIKAFMSDGGGEFINDEFDKYLKEHGIERRVTAPYSPSSNGTCERKNRFVVEMSRCLLSQSKLPLNLWAECINCSIYIQNRCPNSALEGKTPYEKFIGKVPNVSYFKSFGCTAYCLKNQPRHKFAPKANKGIFVGYQNGSKSLQNLFARTEKSNYFPQC